MSRPLSIALLCCSLWAVAGYGQLQNIEWQRTIGGNGDDILSCVLETSDGGFILAGDSNSGISGNKTVASYGGSDYWVMKLNSFGQIEWQYAYGGSGDDFLETVFLDSDDCILLGGQSSSGVSGIKNEPNIGLFDYWIIKIDSRGHIIWQNTIGGMGQDHLEAICKSQDGGYMVGGWSSSPASNDKSEDPIGFRDYWIVKLYGNGDVQWDNTIGGNGYDHLNELIPIHDGGYLLVGDSDSNVSGDKNKDSMGAQDYWVLKVDDLGQIVWQNTLGGTERDVPWSATHADKNNFILAGTSRSDTSGDKTGDSHGGNDYWVVKIDNTGNIIWQQTIGGNDNDGLSKIYPDHTGGYTLGGISSSDASGLKTEDSRGLNDYWVVHIDPAGAIEYQKTIGGSDQDILLDVLQLSSGAYVMAGYSRSNISGDKSQNSFGGTDYWVVKMDGVLSSGDVSTNPFVLAPNPVSDVINIDGGNRFIETLIIHDAVGREIYRDSQPSNRKEIQAGHWPAGIYMVSVVADAQITSIKIIKQ